MEVYQIKYRNIYNNKTLSLHTDKSQNKFNFRFPCLQSKVINYRLSLLTSATKPEIKDISYNCQVCKLVSPDQNQKCLFKSNKVKIDRKKGNFSTSQFVF